MRSCGATDDSGVYGTTTSLQVSPSPSIRDTLAHIAGGEWIWLERFYGRSHMALPPASELPDLVAVRARLEELDSALLQFVSGLDAAGLERAVEFKTFAGQQFSTPLQPLLQHLANHGTYHRGQVTTLLRQLGAKGVSTDLTAFQRERFANSQTQARAAK